MKEYKFHRNKSFISISSIDINKILVPNKLPFNKEDFKHFIGYGDTKKIRLFMQTPSRNVYIEAILVKLNACIFW